MLNDTQRGLLRPSIAYELDDIRTTIVKQGEKVRKIFYKTKEEKAVDDMKQGYEKVKEGVQ